MGLFELVNHPLCIVTRSSAAKRALVLRPVAHHGVESITLLYHTFYPFGLLIVGR